MLKPVFRLLPLVFLVAACDSNKKAASAAKPPKAEIVEEEEDAAPTTVAAPAGAAHTPAPKAIAVPEEGAPAPRAIAVSEDELTAPATPHPSSSRQSRPSAVEPSDKPARELKTAARKTGEATVVAEEHSKDAIEIAKEKTETGLRNAAGATGRFFQRAGEKIEEAAKDAQNP